MSDTDTLTPNHVPNQVTLKDAVCISINRRDLLAESKQTYDQVAGRMYGLHPGGQPRA